MDIKTLSIMGVIIYKIFGLAAFVMSFVLLLYFSTNPAIMALQILLGAETSIVASIIVDVAINRSNHNLMPFELIATSIVILLPAFAGAYLAALINFLKRR